MIVRIILLTYFQYNYISYNYKIDIMTEISGKRRISEEKQAFHNLVVSCPFFISSVPTNIIAFQKDAKITINSNVQQRAYYNGHRFVKTKLIYFNTLAQAKEFHSQYQSKIKQQDATNQWCQYCKDLSKTEGVLFQLGRVYVSAPDNRELKQFLNEFSQMVIVDGFCLQEFLKRSGHPLFRFLDHNILSLEYAYYRWRVYSYLQGDGQKRFRTDPFCIMQGGAEWYPPSPSSIQCGLLNYKQRKFFHQLLFKLSRKKNQIQEAMVFAIFNISSAVQIAAIITLQILDKLQAGQDFIKLFYLISDILFNTTTPTYRRLFARAITFIIYRFTTKQINKDNDHKYRSQLKALIQLWEIKFIFQQNYTKGLLFLLNFDTPSKTTRIHQKLRDIGNIQDDRQSQYQLQTICIFNGIPFLQNDKAQSTRLINQYLWLNNQTQQKIPQIKQQVDGEPISEKDLQKIRSKQVKVICTQGTAVNMLLQRNWQTKSRTSNSVDFQ